MGSSAIEISNRALEQCNVDPITSLDDQTKPARLCRRLFPQLRDEMLRLRDWNFARRRAVLPALAAAPIWGPAQAFTLPADCLRVLPHHDDRWCPAGAFAARSWRIEGQTIVSSDGAPLYIRYTASVTEDQFDAAFVGALAARLAAEMCIPLTNDRSLVQVLESRAQNRLAAAGGTNFSEQPEPWGEASGLLVRHLV